RPGMPSPLTAYKHCPRGETSPADLLPAWRAPPAKPRRPPDHETLPPVVHHSRGPEGPGGSNMERTAGGSVGPGGSFSSLREGGVREAAAPRLLGERSAGFGRAATAARLAVAPGARACRPPRGGRARRREEEGRTSEESGREGGRSPLGAIPRSSCARGPSCSEAVLCGQGPRAPRGAPRGRLGPARANPAGSSPRQGGASSRSTFASLRPHHSPRLTLLGWRGSQKCSGVPRGKYKATARAAHAATIVSRQFAFAGDRTNNWKMGTW
ncbi:unnamed protein product, partial [Prorocentrum cordatum]